MVEAEPDHRKANPLKSALKVRSCLRDVTGLPLMSKKRLRHMHATLALKAGVPVRVVSERLGNASTSFTMDTYAHVLPGMQEDAAEMVAGLVAGSGVERVSKPRRSHRPVADE